MSARARVARSSEAVPGQPTDTQRRLLAAALSLFAERGFDGASTSEIAGSAGVAEKTLFANFGSKEGLYQATLGPASLRVLFVSEAVRTLLPILEHPAPDVRALLRAILTNRVRFAAEHPRELRLIAQHFLARPESIAVLLGAFATRARPILDGILDRLVGTGSIRADLPRAALIRMVAGQAVAYVLARNLFLPGLDWDDEREIDQMVTVLLDGLAPKATGRAEPGRAPKAQAARAASPRGPARNPTRTPEAARARQSPPRRPR